MPDFGPVGGCVQTVADTSPFVVETQSNHGLADGDRVRIQLDKADATPLLAYVNGDWSKAKRWNDWLESPEPRISLTVSP